EGCSLQLVVDVQPFDCSSAGLQTSYSINGATAVTGQAQVTITEGDAIDLGILPIGTAFSVNGPNGNDKPLNNDILNISDAQTADAGTYTFTTTEGCSLQLVVDVQPFDCSSLNYELQYSSNESSEFVSTQSATVIEGETIIIRLAPESVSFSITGPNQNSKPFDNEEFIITDAVTDDQGVYVFTTGNGCSFNFDLTITPNETLSNPSLDKITVYPNPVTYGTLFLALDEFMNQALTANLFDVYGKLVISKEFAINHRQEESLNITSLSGGLYILEISLIDSNETLLKKVIKLD
ncbi:T9SS type A sorting domain-containing protein, partial [uncultured Maribacter sp.]|uniref:T9SS type A sorting domain-containing protein n=1 Tax=uncultured Maribacter sp. TaxID=431308 RepID=UPI0030DC71C4